MVTDVTSAEMIKYASNAFLATRISFINEMALLCDRVGASIDAVSEGLAMDARTGGRIYAGVGYGGSCFPKDVRALDYLALTSGVSVDLLRSVININNRQRLLPLFALRERFNGNMTGLRVGVLGLAFKPDTDDVRDAPSLDLIKALVDEEVEVLAYDPQAMETARPHLPPAVELVDDPLEAADRAQALVLVTEWDQVVNADWNGIARCMRPRGSSTTAETRWTRSRWNDSDLSMARLADTHRIVRVMRRTTRLCTRQAARPSWCLGNRNGQWRHIGISEAIVANKDQRVLQSPFDRPASTQ